jgi:hypothetical protein
VHQVVIIGLRTDILPGLSMLNKQRANIFEGTSNVVLMPDSSCFLGWLVLSSEDGGDVFLRNGVLPSPDYIALYRRRDNSSYFKILLLSPDFMLCGVSSEERGRN